MLPGLNELFFPEIMMHELGHDFFKVLCCKDSPLVVWVSKLQTCFPMPLHLLNSTSNRHVQLICSYLFISYYSEWLWTELAVHHIDGLVQERWNSTANALELHLSCTNPSIFVFRFIFLWLLVGINRAKTSTTNETKLANHCLKIYTIQTTGSNKNFPELELTEFFVSLSMNVPFHPQFCQLFRVILFLIPCLKQSGIDSHPMQIIGFNKLRWRQNGSHFADNIFECIFLNENFWFFKIEFHWNMFLRVW